MGFCFNILNNPISSLEKWGYFNDKVCVCVYIYIYFTSTSVCRRLSPLAEAYPFRGVYPCPQVWRGSRGKSCPATLLRLTRQDDVCFARVTNSRQTCCLWCQVSPNLSGMAQYGGQNQITESEDSCLCLSPSHGIWHFPI